MNRKIITIVSISYMLLHFLMNIVFDNYNNPIYIHSFRIWSENCKFICKKVFTEDEIETNDLIRIIASFNTSNHKNGNNSLLTLTFYSIY